jgi:hypothetical protein
MKLLPILLLALVSSLEAQNLQPQCPKVEFNGEVAQGRPYSQQLGGNVSFSVLPMRLREDPRYGWFQLRIIGEGSGFVFNLSDRNWLLATDFYSAFIGGTDSDVKAALSYR